ncbi:hypothetical protein AAZX31_13G176800 [Glycine max]
MDSKSHGDDKYSEPFANDRILILGPTGRLLIEDQLKINAAIKEAGNIKVRYIRVSNETSYGVMEFVHAWKVKGLTKKK